MLKVCGQPAQERKTPPAVWEEDFIMQFILASGCDRDISFSKFYNACIYQLVEKLFFHEMICLLLRQRHDGQHPNLVANCSVFNMHKQTLSWQTLTDVDYL